MSTRPLYLLLLLHRPQGAAAFSARDAPVDEGGSGRAAAQHVGPEAAVGRKLSHLNPAGHYEHFSTGASCEANGCATVSTAAECQAAAQALASATVYGSYDSSYAPLGCYAYVSGPSSWYYFNTADSATGTCSSSPLCVCACGTFPPTSPPSPPALPPMLPSPPTLPPPPLPPMTPTRVGDAKYGCGHAGAHVRSVSPASDGQPETLSNGDLVTAVLDSSVTCIKLANGTYYLSSTLTIGHTVALVAENGRAVLDGGGGGFVVVDVASSGDAALSNLVVQNGGGAGGVTYGLPGSNLTQRPCGSGLTGSTHPTHSVQAGGVSITGRALLHSCAIRNNQVSCLPKARDHVSHLTRPPLSTGRWCLSDIIFFSRRSDTM